MFFLFLNSLQALYQFFACTVGRRFNVYLSLQASPFGVSKIEIAAFAMLYVLSETRVPCSGFSALKFLITCSTLVRETLHAGDLWRNVYHVKEINPSSLLGLIHSTLSGASRSDVFLIGSRHSHSVWNSCSSSSYSSVDSMELVEGSCDGATDCSRNKSSLPS